ncbi:probable disease resistance protein At5g63020 [Prunus avium]|uniref:Probable disease resistance protein At5g63020 n=1 Tax=Prunus avium TaxID=42229 RepID=A0A6P5SP67_PRUAV|nr:probable disease resistance protein At5g63020 [Prunus avium]
MRKKTLWWDIYRRNTKELVGKTPSAFEKIMKCVSEKEVGIICVYGMSGSENIGSTDAAIDALQQDIKKEFQLDRNAGNRADTLESELWRRRFLIVLDDMGKELSLEHIGIPWQTNNGSKTKKHSSCSRLKLALDYHTRAAAEDIVRECDGLPVAIAGLAQTLKEIKKFDPNDVDAEWNGAFYKLRNSIVLLERMNRKAFARLKYSYSMLKKEAQQCFLYCALYPPGHCIEKKELVEHWFWEGLLGSRKRIKGQLIEDMIQAREILDEIERAYLLETVSEGGNECIKMRNFIRHMAVHLTNTRTDHDQFLIKAGEKLTDCPLLVKNLSKVERASLMRSSVWGSEKGASSMWGSEKASSIQELGALQHLAILQVNFLDAKSFNTYVS